MTKLDANLQALYEALTKDDPGLADRAREFAEIVQTARQALDERTASGTLVQTVVLPAVTLPGDLPLAVRVTIAVSLDDARPAPPAVRRAEQFVEALETAFTAQLRLLQATLD